MKRLFMITMVVVLLLGLVSYSGVTQSAALSLTVTAPPGFTLHTTADIYHSNVWRTQLNKLVAEDGAMQQRALAAAEDAARCLWKALDGIERERQERKAA